MEQGVERHDGQHGKQVLDVCWIGRLKLWIELESEEVILLEEREPIGNATDAGTSETTRDEGI